MLIRQKHALSQSMTPFCLHRSPLFLKIIRGVGHRSGNRKNGGGKQGRGNQPPYRRYGPDTEIQYRPRKPHGPANPAQFSPKGKPIRNFSIDHIWCFPLEPFLKSIRAFSVVGLKMNSDEWRLIALNRSE